MDRRNLLKSVTLAGSALAVPAFVAPALADATNAAAPLIEKFAATLSAHDLTAFAALFSDNYVNHQLSAAAPPPPQGKSPKQGTVAVFYCTTGGNTGPQGRDRGHGRVRQSCGRKLRL
jgi:hypothetical protein